MLRFDELIEVIKLEQTIGTQRDICFGSFRYPDRCLEGKSDYDPSFESNDPLKRLNRYSEPAPPDQDFIGPLSREQLYPF